MNFELAVRVLSLVTEHERTNTRPGRIAADLVGETLKCSRGQALSLIIEAQETFAKGPLCPTCSGKGRIPNA